MPRNVTLPDGRILVIPDNATPDQLAALRNKIGTQYADIRTGAGMGEKAATQAQGDIQRLGGQMKERDVLGRDVPTMSQGEQEAGYSNAFAKEGQRPGSIVLSDADVAMLGTGIGGIGRSIATKGLKATAVPVARAVLGGAAGAYGGGKAGKYLGGDTGEAIGKTVGGFAGGVLGGAGVKVPTRSSLITSLLGAEEAPKTVPTPKLSPFEGATSSASPRWQGPTPPPTTSAPPPPVVGSRAITSRLGGGGISESAAGTRNLVLTPQEAQTEDFMQGMAKRRASERGMQFAGGMTPREGRSVPAGPTRSVTEEYPGPRSVTTFGSAAEPVASPPPPEASTPALRPEVQEMATRSKAMQTPEWVRQQEDFEVRRLQDILRNPKATAEERGIAESQLAHYRGKTFGTQ